MTIQNHLMSNQTELYFPGLPDSPENADGSLLPGLCACSSLLLSQDRAEQLFCTIIRQKTYFLHYIEFDSKLSLFFLVFHIWGKLWSLVISITALKVRFLCFLSLCPPVFPPVYQECFLLPQSTCTSRIIVHHQSWLVRDFSIL